MKITLSSLCKCIMEMIVYSITKSLKYCRINKYCDLGFVISVKQKVLLKLKPRDCERYLNFETDIPPTDIL